MPPMATVSPWEALLSHLQATTRLERGEAEKVIRETLEYFSESLPDFVARRHRELRDQGVRNEAIYRRIAGEVADRRFLAGPLTQRQVRRLVYG